MTDSPTRPVLSEKTEEMLEDVMAEYDLNTYDQAVRQIGRKAGYDV